MGCPWRCGPRGPTGTKAPNFWPWWTRGPPVAGKPGRPRRKPAAILGDRAFDSQPLREALWARGIVPFLAKRGEEHGSGLGAYRWVVERTFAWFKGFRRLRLRFERTAFMHEAAFTLAACLICFRAL